ncbi:hypothetical protein OG417_36975 [Actinoallomurus sp. NBC_01490]|uniref:hypothetical protein n=1 Tax=Actinoallomurus sp. NBC_01490 TaxID=2903557 RepID=UPI002E3559DC|nr:hypothetical protein [Actinoallomurus sp. NBC_01490]
MSDYLTFDLKTKKQPTNDSKVWDSIAIYHFVSRARPDKVENIGQEYQKAAASYDRIASFIRRVAGKIHDKWNDGSGSVSAQRQLAQLYQAAQEVSHACNTVGKPIEHHGKVSLADFRQQITHGPLAERYRTGIVNYVDPNSVGYEISSYSPFDPTDDTEFGARHLLSEHIKKTQSTYAAIPNQFFVDLPLAAKKRSPPRKTANPPPHGDDDGTGTSFAGTGATPGSTTAGLPVGYDPGGPAYPSTAAGSGQGTDLSGLGRPPSLVPSPTSGTGLASTNPYTNRPPVSPPHAGAVSGSPTGTSPLVVRSGRSDGLPSAAQNAQNAATAAQEAAARGPSTVPFMPVGGKDAEKKERERTIWVYEEDKIWGADDDDVAPPLIE